MRSKPSENPSIDEIIRTRRTIHNFKPEPLPPVETLIQALESARWAPNHHMTEPWQFYVLGPETIERVIELNSRIIREKKGDKAAEKKYLRWSRMPGWLVISCDRSHDTIRQKEDYAACCCLVQNLMLSLWDAGIGMKWSTGDVIRDERFYDLLWIDKEVEEVIGIFWYGYPGEIPVTARKPVDQVLVKLP